MTGRLTGAGRWLAVALLWLVAGAAAPAPLHQALVTVSLAADGARATVKLDRAVTRFVFAAVDTVRNGTFELLTPGLTFADDTVTGRKPFTQFTLRIRAETREHDGKYPAYYTVGRGGLLYVPALLGGDGWQSRIRLIAAPGTVRLPVAESLTNGYVFIGPRAAITDTPDLTVVADPTTPRWLTDASRAELGKAVRYFSTALGIALPRKPLLVVKNIDDGTGFVGDVTPGPVTALRFHGAPATPDPVNQAQITGFVFHEAFHFWNGGIADNRPGTPTWLHEGGADYAALLAARATGSLDDKAVADRLAGALTNCQAGLASEGDKPPAAIGFLSMKVRYPCGMVLQWAFDLHVRRASDDRRTVLDAWGAMIRRASKRPDRHYTLPDFYAATGVPNAAALPPVGLIVDQSGPARWDTLPMALGALVRAATVETRRPELLFHLLANSCKGLPKGTGYGFVLNDGILKLDSPAGCGAIVGNPVIRSIEGGDAVEVSSETYAAVARRCAAGEAVTLTTAEGRRIEAPCTSPLKPAPKGYVVRSWRSGAARVG